MTTKLDIKSYSFAIYTKGFTDIHDITDKVREFLYESGFSEGNVLVFAPGATTGITTIEHEPGLIIDYPELLEKLIPSNKEYHHDKTWNDGNGFSHLRAAIQGCSITVPFINGKLQLGTWQQIIFIDFDNRERKRKIVLQFTGK